VYACSDGELHNLEYLQPEPRQYLCKLPEGTLHLTNPSLSLQQFEELLSSFLDTDLLFVKENEYRQSLSVFAPIRDALSKSNLNESDIDLCLLAGGSSLTEEDFTWSVLREAGFKNIQYMPSSPVGITSDDLRISKPEQPV